MPFIKGTYVTVKLIPNDPSPRETYLYYLNELQRKFRKRDPFKGMTDDEIMVELRRQREEMDDD